MFCRDQKQALNSAYRSLARRAHSRLELKEKLERKKYSNDTIREVLAELETKRFLDDRAFAFSFAGDLLNRRSFGRERVALELRTRGIADTLIEETLRPLYREIDEPALAQKALNKRVHFVKRPPTASDLRRLTDFLRRKGFSYEAIRKTIKTDDEIC
jgi:regulatory protein